MQQCRIIYCSLAALHVSSDTFAHHQEHLNCIYSLWYYTRESLPAGFMGVFMTYFHKTPKIKFQGNPSSRKALTHADRRKDGPTDRRT